jgi:hypothetical protein
MADGHPVRDIKNHLLFEIATEVAHRGESHSAPRGPWVTLASAPVSAQCWAKHEELATLTCDLLCSRWYLLCAQIQGSGHYG